MIERFILRKLNELGLKQRDVAKKLQLHPTGVNALIRGTRQLKIKEVKPLAELLQVSPLDILDTFEKK